MALVFNDISKIAADAMKMKHDVKVGDIAYLILLHNIKEHNIAYATLFGKDFTQEDLDKYEKSPKMKFLYKYLKNNYYVQLGWEIPDGKNSIKDITFEENKEEIIKLIEETKQRLAKGEIKASEALKIQTDLRVKLNDKFAVNEKQEEQRVIVESKYNDICPYCNHEIRRKTDKDMIAELEKIYDLVPKDKGEETI